MYPPVHLVPYMYLHVDMYLHVHLVPYMYPQIHLVPYMYLHVHLVGRDGHPHRGPIPPIWRR